MRVSSRILLTFALTCSFSALFADMAVLGDSLAVGSLSHPTFHWDVSKFQDYLASDLTVDPSSFSPDFRESLPLNEQAKIKGPTRFWEGPEEHKNPTLEKRAELIARAIYVGKYIDIEEHAWPFLMGTRRGLSPRQILLTAETGNRSADTDRQAARLLQRNKQKLPKDVFVFFAGNDLCSQNLGAPVEPVKTGWTKSVLSGVERLIVEGTASLDGTTIYVMTPVNLIPLIDSDAILEKKIYAFGQERTCREFRKFDPSQMDESAKMTPFVSLVLKHGLKSEKNLPPVISECRSVLQLDKGSRNYDAQLARLKEYVKAYEDAAEDTVRQAEKLAEASGKNIKVRLLTSPSRVDGNPEHIANDCFHLSLRGQESLARSLMKEIDSRD